MNAMEVAKLLDVHPETIRRMIRSGKIKAEKEGRSYDIPAFEVDYLLSFKNAHDSHQAIEKSAMEIVKEYERKIIACIGIMFKMMEELQEKSGSIESIPMDKNLVKRMNERYKTHRNLWANGDLKRFIDNILEIKEAESMSNKLKGLAKENREIKERFGNSYADGDNEKEGGE